MIRTPTKYQPGETVIIDGKQTLIQWAGVNEHGHSMYLDGNGEWATDREITPVGLIETSHEQS